MSKISNTNEDLRPQESGNVLFLILIAVALFAALSYAVTQSSRSGAGDANSETNLISSASLTQYPASIRTAIIRMIISNNVSATTLNFDPPPYTNLSTNTLKAQGVFYPSTDSTAPGGGATYAEAPADVMADNNPGTWYFSGSYAVENLGLASAGSGNEIVAFLPGIKEAICTKINDELGIPTTDRILTPDIDVTAAAVQMDYDYTFPTTTTATIGTTGGAASFDGQPFGCFQDNNLATTEYVYYHVLVER